MKKLLILFGIILSVGLNAQIPGSPNASGVITPGAPWVTGVTSGDGELKLQFAYLNVQIDTKANLITQENQTGTTYTFVLGDAGKLVTLSNAAAITLTIPTNASVAFPVNTIITIQQAGAGLVTIDDGSVTMNSYGDADALLGQWAMATLVKTGTDIWALSGAIE